MTQEPQAFDIAAGRCSIRDGDLIIDRPDPANLGRMDVFRIGLAENIEHRPVVTVTGLSLYLALLVVLGYLLISLYLSNPAVVPLVGLLAVFGILAVIVPIERIYRRIMSKRDELQTTLEKEFRFIRPDRIPLDDIMGVTVRQTTLEFSPNDAHLLLVHFQHEGAEATTAVGLPGYMSEELAIARTIFEGYGLWNSKER